MQSTQHTMEPIDLQDLDRTDALSTDGLDLGVQELDEFVAPFDFDDFKEGAALGAGLGAAAGAAALAVAT